MKAKTLYLMYLCLMSAALQGQVTLESTFDVKHNFQQVSSRSYYVDGIDLLNSQEQLKYRPSREVDNISIFTTEDGQREMEIVHVEHSNLSPDWLDQPAKTIVSGSKIYSLDREGRVFVELPHSEKSEQLFSEYELPVVENFISVTSTDVDILIRDGYGVNYLTPSRIMISSPRAQLIIDNEELYYATEVFDRDGVSVTKSESWFQEVSNQIVPLKNRYSYRKDNALGLCATEVIEKSFDQYQIETRTNERSSRISKNEKINYEVEIYPNPSNLGFVSLKVDGSLNISEKLEALTISTITGKRIDVSYRIGSNSLIVIDTENLLAGTYVVDLNLGGKLISKKLIIQN